MDLKNTFNSLKIESVLIKISFACISKEENASCPSTSYGLNFSFQLDSSNLLNFHFILFCGLMCTLILIMIRISFCFLPGISLNHVQIMHTHVQYTTITLLATWLRT